MADTKLQLLEAFLDAYNMASWDRLESLVTENYVHHNNELALTLGQFKNGAAWIRAALPDFRIDVEDMLVDHDQVAVRFVGRGTHLGSIFGEEATSRPVIVHGITVYRFEGDRIAEDWEAMDEHSLRVQVGATGLGE